MKRIAIFASGGGSNALKFLQYFEDVADVEIALIVTNKSTAGVLSHAAAYDISTLVLSRPYFYDSSCILEVLHAEKIDMIVLAGFLWLVPGYLVAAYPQHIVNIHPALLPLYGGKGMYGKHVHKAVKAAGDAVTGMTVHYVNEQYDDGGHIYQAKCQLSETDTAEDIASKVLALEHRYYAPVVHSILVPGADHGIPLESHKI